MSDRRSLIVGIAMAVLCGAAPSGQAPPQSTPAAWVAANQGEESPGGNGIPGRHGLQETEKRAEKSGTGTVEYGSIKPPKLIKAVTPQYPERALDMGIQGVVVIEATTDETGRVTSAKILKSVPRLDQAAVKAIKKWVFEPAVIDGRPRRIIFTVTMRFTLGYMINPTEPPVVDPPHLIRRVEPVYPEAAKKAGLQGTVVLGATIDGDGQVTDVKVLESVPGLDQAAVDAVKQWQYGPVYIDGHPAVFTFTVTVKFSLK